MKDVILWLIAALIIALCIIAAEGEWREMRKRKDKGK